MCKLLAEKPQVVVLNKVDVSEVREREEELVAQLREACGHSRVMTISAATTKNVKELMGRLKKFVDAEKKNEIAEGESEGGDVLLAEVDFSKAALDSDSDDYGRLMEMFVCMLLRSTVTKALVSTTIIALCIHNYRNHFRPRLSRTVASEGPIHRTGGKNDTLGVPRGSRTIWTAASSCWNCR